MTYYNIRDYVCESPPGHEEEVANLYNKINLMCYLLHEIPYEEVYGDLEATLQKLLPRLDAAQVPGFLADAKPYMAIWKPLFEALRAAVQHVNTGIAGGTLPQELAGHAQHHRLDPGIFSKLELRLFFEVRFNNDPTMKAINAIWEAIYAVKPEYLCLPWVFIQGDTGQPLVARGVMSRQITLATGVHLKDFFTTPKTGSDPAHDRVRAAHAHGKANGILARMRPGVDELVILGGGGDDANWLKCNTAGTGCEQVTTRHFCNLTQNGCSTSSG